MYSGITWAPGHSSTGGWPRCHSPIWGQGLPMPNPLHLLWRAGLGYPVLLKFMGPTQGTFSLHSAFVGGELLPAAPLQPCAEAPSGRGHLFSGWVNLAPCNFSQQQCPPCSTGMGHPLGMAPCAKAPHPVGFIRSVGYIRALPVYSLPTIAHYCPLYHLVSFLRAITLSVILA